METKSPTSRLSGALSLRLSVVAAREQGVSPELLPLISTDPEVLDAFYREHIEQIQRFVARRIGNRERAADLTADIFLAAISSAPRYRARMGTPKAWLYGIARNVLANDIRYRERRRAAEDQLRGSALLDEDDAARLEARIDATENARELYTAMASLPDGERAILELVALDELSLAEAAAAMEIRAVTARVRLHRARRKLRAELRQLNPEAE